MNSTPAISTRLGLLAALCLCHASGTYAQAPCERGRLVASTASAYVGSASFTTNGSLYFLDPIAGTLDVVDLPAGITLPRTFLSDLHAPLAVAASGAGLYFTEGGTESGQFHDGTLSWYDPVSRRATNVCRGLHYPNALFVDPTGAVYVVEAAGSSTAFGGKDRLIRFPPASTNYEVVLPLLPTPTSVAVSRSGTIWIGSYGQSLPGNTGRLLAYAPPSISPVILAQNLPSVTGLAVDASDNLYLSGWSDSNTNSGVFVMRQGASRVAYLSSGVPVTALALNGACDLHYATFYPGESTNSIHSYNVCGDCPPYIEITSPPSDSVFVSSDAITIHTSATDSAGNIANVQFFLSGKLLGEVTEAPFVWTFSITEPGGYLISVRSSDKLGNSVTSQPVPIRIVPSAPAIATALKPQTVYETWPVSLAVSVTGASPRQFQWWRNGSALAGETNSAFSLDQAQLQDAGEYFVEVANAFGSVTSAVVRLNVRPLPPIEPLAVQKIASVPSPEPNLVEGADGKLYGVFRSSGFGIFQFTRQSGSLNVVTQSFNPSLRGPTWRPLFSLAGGKNGKVYGTTAFYDGNKVIGGTCFQLQSNNTLKTLLAFDSANRFSTGCLVEDDDGALYGGSQNSFPTGFSLVGSGTIFRIGPDGHYANLHAFRGNEGSFPQALALASDGQLYGACLGGLGFNGNANSGHGALFKLTRDGFFVPLVIFNGTNGSRPSLLVRGPDGDFYGSTELGGQFNQGTLFRLSANGEFVTLLSFNGISGARPNSLVVAPDRSLYGTTAYGGAGFLAAADGPSGGGTVFKRTRSGTFHTLAFPFGSQPGGLMQTVDGTLFGTARDSTRGAGSPGSLFQLTPASTIPRPQITRIDLTNGAMGLSWAASPDVIYQVYATESLTPASWLEPLPPTLTTNSVGVVVDPDSDKQQRFYRVELLSLP